MLVFLVALFVHIVSFLATNADYCNVHHMHDSVGHPGIVVTCQSGN